MLPFKLVACYPFTVTVEDKALPFFPERFSSNTSIFENFVAQGFGKFLSKNQSVSILLYTKGVCNW